jgi:hypothetical protein
MWRSDRAPPGTHVPSVEVRKFVREVTKADRCRGPNKAHSTQERSRLFCHPRHPPWMIATSVKPCSGCARLLFAAAPGQHDREDDLLLRSLQIRITTLILSAGFDPDLVTADVARAGMVPRSRGCRSSPSMNSTSPASSCCLASSDVGVATFLRESSTGSRNGAAPVLVSRSRLFHLDRLRLQRRCIR